MVLIVFLNLFLSSLSPMYGYLHFKDMSSSISLSSFSPADFCFFLFRCCFASLLFLAESSYGNVLCPLSSSLFLSFSLENSFCWESKTINFLILVASHLIFPDQWIEDLWKSKRILLFFDSGFSYMFLIPHPWWSSLFGISYNLDIANSLKASCSYVLSKGAIL